MSGLLKDGLVGNVAEEDTGGQFDIIAVTVRSYGVGRLLTGCGSIIVGAAVTGIGVTVGQVAGLPVAVYHTVLTGIEYILAVCKEGEFIVLHAKGILVVGISVPPAGGVAHIGTAAHVTLSLVVIDPDLAVDAVERVGGACIRALGNEFVVPGDAVGIVRGIDSSHELKLLLHVGSGLLHYKITGALNNALMRNIREDCSAFKYQVNLLDTFFGPFVFEGIGVSLVLYREEVILVSCLGLGAELGTLVGVSLAVGGGVGVFALVVEGKDIVIEEAALSVGLARPPSQRITHGTAAEVAVLRAVPDPVLACAAGEGTDVRRRIERVAVGVLQGEVLHHGAYGCAEGVVGLDLNGVGAGFAETELKAVSGIGIFLILLAVDELVRAEDPDGGHSLVLEVEGDVVCLLVNVNLDVKGGRLGDGTL